MAVNNPKEIAKLLRAMANGTDAQKNKHDIIFKAAAERLEQSVPLEATLRALHDALAPGMVVTVGGREIDHTELNGAKLRAGLQLSLLDCV